jgi:hypothetical protein
MTVISFPLERVRRTNAQITTFDAQNIVHALLSVEASPTTRKTRPFVDLDQNYCNYLPVGESSSYKRPNNGILSVEDSKRSIKRRYHPNSSQNATIRRFGQKMAEISFPLERVRPLNVQITACSAQNIAPAILSVETSPTARKMPPFVDLDKNWP